MPTPTGYGAMSFLEWRKNEENGRPVSFQTPTSVVRDYDISIQSGQPWGGLGIRVETRGFQWNNPQARDAIFWEYNISNTSEYDLPEVCFGYWVDNAIGGDGADDGGCGHQVPHRAGRRLFRSSCAGLLVAECDGEARQRD